MGTKRNYKCAKCNKNLYLLLHATHSGVTLYVEEKDHEGQHESVYHLPKDTMAFVIEMIKNHHTNRFIMRSIFDCGLPQITIEQLRNFRGRYMKKKYGEEDTNNHDYDSEDHRNTEAAAAINSPPAPPAKRSRRA